MDGFWYDLRLAIRSLARRPGFATVVVLTLALGIGATTGVFSAVHAVLLADMPYPEAERLVYGIATFKGRTTGFSGPECFDYFEQSTSFASLAAHLQYAFTLPLTGRERPENVSTTLVSVDFFNTLGVSPTLGRTFNADEGRPAPLAAPDQSPPFPDVAIVSHRLWKSRLGGAREVVGSSLTLGGRAVTVVGVMPEGYRFFADADLWMPMRLNGPIANIRRFHNWVLVGRLKPGVTMAQAQGELDTIAARLEKQYPDSNTGMGVRLSGLHEALIQQVRPALLLVMGAVGLMLLIACGNVASLTLARAVTRRSELAMRVALGASRGRLVRQLVTESVLLALAGGSLGLAVAAALQQVLPTLLDLGGNRLPLSSFHLDPGVVAFAFTVSLLTGIAVGLVPALRSASLAPFEELKGGTRTVGSGRSSRERMVLVAAQVALSLVLLLGSALLLRSFSKLMSVGLGFDPENLLTSSVSLPTSVGEEEATAFFTAVLADIRALPGVTAAAMADRLPIANPWGSIQVWTPEHPEQRSFSRQALAREVLPGYFSALGMTLMAGRDIDETDRIGAPPAVVINQTMARLLFDEANPVGRTVLTDLGGSEPASLEVVGLVADARINRLDEEPRAAMYMSFLQYPSSSARVAIRTTSDAGGVTTALRQLVARHRADVPVQDVAMMTTIVHDSTAAQRSLTAIVTCFALFALLLAAVGLFGVLAYQVNQRQHEIGIRMALGALPHHILGTVLRQAALATGLGIAAGAAAAMALTRLMSRLLFDVAPHDPLSLAAAVSCLLGVALIACLSPAARAMRVQPMTALRCE